MSSSVLNRQGAKVAKEGNNMIPRTHCLLSLLACLTLAGCQTGQVVVIDSVGRRIEGASVEPVSLSMNGRPEQTDHQGKAKVPLFIPQDLKWIKVSKQGYQTQQVERPDDWPLIIKLSAIPD